MIISEDLIFAATKLVGRELWNGNPSPHEVDVVRLVGPLIAEWARKQTLETFRPLLDDLTDPDDCWFDHHGGCQAHGYLDLQPGQICPQQEAKDVLAALGEAR